MNTDEPDTALRRAEVRVLEIQTKLHRWARDDADRKFDDLFNLVSDPAFLLVGWDRVRGNKGAKTAGWTARQRHPSWSRSVSRSSSTNCGARSRTVVSGRCRCGNG